MPMSVLSIVAKRKDEVPEHELSAGHLLLSAMRDRESRMKLRDAKKIRPSGVIACERVRELIYDLACIDGFLDDNDQFKYGWIAHAQKALGLSYTTAWNITRGEITSISSRTVDALSRKSGVPVGKFYDVKE